jgi:glyoxylase-like metal-dependent hydrolase (beta-lactamase superfamily II)
MKSFVEEDPSLKGMYWVTDAGACSGVYVLDEGRTIIDVGNMYGLADELQDLGPLTRLERILLTHAHFDHVGGVEEIYQIVSPNVYVHPVAREYLRMHRSPFPEFFDALEKDGKLRLIRDGDRIDGAPTLKVIHTPGHTAGDVCYFDEQTGSLFTGDTVLPHRYKLGPMLTKPDEMQGGRMKDKLASIKRLLSLPVRHLFPGHGEPVFQRGADQVKLTLYSLYSSQYQDQPERAWTSMGMDLLELGQFWEARQCLDKAVHLAPQSPETEQLKERIQFMAQAQKGA